MLYESLEILREQVAKYLEKMGLGSNIVVLDSIAHFIDSPNRDNKVILSLINLQEETALKNQRN